MPDLRAKQASHQASLESFDAQLVDRDTWLKLAENLDSFLARLRETADTGTIEDRQKVALRDEVGSGAVGRAFGNPMVRSGASPPFGLLNGESTDHAH